MPVIDLPDDEKLKSWPVSGLINIIDLEYTSWEGAMESKWSEKWQWREVVQIGAIKVSGADFDVVNVFNRFVRPEQNPILSDYFISLSGISQQKMELLAVPAEQAIKELIEFLDNDTTIFNGNDGRVLRENIIIGNLDLYFKRNQMFNFRPLLSCNLRRAESELVSSQLPQIAGFKVDLVAHTALDDCRAIASALSYWRRTNIL